MQRELGPSWSAVALVVFGAHGCAHHDRVAPPAWPEPEAANASANPNASPNIANEASPGPPWDARAAIAAATVVFARGPSQHMGATVDGEVLANAQAAHYATVPPDTSLPEGATVFERHFATGSAAVTSVFAMVKRPPGYGGQEGDWEYFVLGANDRVEQRGRLRLCARCHADGPRDHLFGGSTNARR